MAKFWADIRRSGDQFASDDLSGVVLFFFLHATLKKTHQPFNTIHCLIEVLTLMQMC